MLVDLGSRDLVAEPPPELTTALEDQLGKQFSRELLRTQIEVGTKVCNDISELRDDLARLRGAVSAIAGEYAMAPIASSTHPFANWRVQKVTDRERYQALGDDLQVVGSRALIGGMHVHVGIEDDDLRIDLLNQLTYFLPHLLAASTSSPFWEGELTGLMSYRTSVFSELPRTGPPEQFESHADYVQTVAVLQDVGLIDDASKIWWDARLSKSFPTIEIARHRYLHRHRRCDLLGRRLPLRLADAHSPAASQPALATILPPADSRKPLARAAIWNRCRTGGLRTGRNQVIWGPV